MANHIPYGYKIENGVAVIDEGQAEQVRTLFSGYLSRRRSRRAYPVPQRCKKDATERALPGR